MSFEIARAIWNYKGRDLNGTQTAILVRMAWYASDSGRDIFPSREELSRQTKFGLSTIRDALAYFRKEGFLIPEKALPGKAVNYRISLERLQLTNQFNDNSSTLPEHEAPTTQAATAQVPRRQPPTTQAATAHIKTSKNIFKNNNSVVDKKLLGQAISRGVTEVQINNFINTYGPERVTSQLRLLVATNGIINPIGWLTQALRKHYEPRIDGPVSIGAINNQIWSPDIYEQQCRERDKLIDPNDWREQELKSFLQQTQKG